MRKILAMAAVAMMTATGAQAQGYDYETKHEEAHFRISSCNPLDENVKYINALGTSTLEKYTIGFETDMSWFVPITKKTKKELRFDTDAEDGYMWINKETMVIKHVSDEEFKEVKKNYD